MFALLFLQALQKTFINFFLSLFVLSKQTPTCINTLSSPPTKFSNFSALLAARCHSFSFAWFYHVCIQSSYHYKTVTGFCFQNTGFPFFITIYLFPQNGIIYQITGYLLIITTLSHQKQLLFVPG